MSIETSPTLVRYYSAVDSSDFDTGMALVTPDVEFAILLPNRAVRGIGRKDLVAYLSGRGDVVRRHVPQRSSIAGNVEFVYGAVLEDETTVTGHFLAAARVCEDGLISAYHVVFDPELGLLPD